MKAIDLKLMLNNVPDDFDVAVFHQGGRCEFDVLRINVGPLSKVGAIVLGPITKAKRRQIGKIIAGPVQMP